MKATVLFLLFLLPLPALADSWACTCVDGTPDGSVAFSECVSPQTNATCWDISTGLVDPSVLGVDSATILYFFTWGFGAVLSCWVIGFALGCVKRLMLTL